MRRARSPIRAGLLLALCALAGPLAAAEREIDPFYAERLHEGIRALGRGDQLEAAEELRIAAFGLLGRPELLAHALTHLALAQSAAGDDEGFAHSYRRLADLERRFGAYSEVRLPAATRAALDRAAAALPKSYARLPAAAPAVAAGAEPPPVELPRVCISWKGDGNCSEPAPVDSEEGAG